MSEILDGRRIRQQIMNECKPRVAQIWAAGRAPGLAVVLVGDDPASAIYVRGKVQACQELGIYSEQHSPPPDVSTEELLELIDGLNLREEIDGILVQMPLPPQVDSRRVLLAVAPEKDVDGFHPVNVGNLVANRPAPRPCTPAGIIELLRRYRIPVAGSHAVVVGRSDIVGKPMALLLLHENATVTVCHSKTRDLPAVCRQADILVAAIGRAGFVTREFIKPGATVIDVGINRLTTADEKTEIFGAEPSRSLVGDVHPLHADGLAGAYTPVPGGVGPLTIAMLMSNTVRAAEARLGCSSPG